MQAMQATPEIQQAYAKFMYAGAELLCAWSAARKNQAELRTLENKGFRPGLLVRHSGEAVEVVVILTDVEGGIEPLENFQVPVARDDH